MSKNEKKPAATPVWFDNPLILMKHSEMSKIWPQDDMTRSEKINAISRLVILMTILGYIMTRSFMYVITGVATLSVLAILYFTSKKGGSDESNEKSKEGFQNVSLDAFTKENKIHDSQGKVIMTKNKNSERHTMPTEDNPFMNVMLPEISSNPTRPSAAPAYDRPIEKQINGKTKEAVMENFDDNEKIRKKLFSTLGDNLEFENMAQHNFYATANTEVPNNQEKFMKFCYGSLPSGKELHIDHTSH